MAERTFNRAPEVKEIARVLIEEHHEALKPARVLYLHVDPTPKSKGRDVIATMKKLGGREQYLSGFASDDGAPFDFVMTVAKSSWGELPDSKRKALIDHELCHARWDPDSSKWTTVDHDVQEFIEVAERHGPWNDGLEKLVAAVAQIDMQLVASG